MQVCGHPSAYQPFLHCPQKMRPALLFSKHEPACKLCHPPDLTTRSIQNPGHLSGPASTTIRDLRHQNRSRYCGRFRLHRFQESNQTPSMVFTTSPCRISVSSSWCIRRRDRVRASKLRLLDSKKKPTPLNPLLLKKTSELAGTPPYEQKPTFCLARTVGPVVIVEIYVWSRPFFSS